MWTLGSKTFVYTACYKGKRNEYQGFRYRFLVKAVSLHRNSDSIETEHLLLKIKRN